MKRWRVRYIALRKLHTSKGVRDVGDLWPELDERTGPKAYCKRLMKTYDHPAYVCWIEPCK